MLQTCVSLLKDLLSRLFADAIQMTSTRKEGKNGVEQNQLPANLH